MKLFLNKDIQKLLTELSRSKAKIVAIDGDTGVRKTSYFAPQISKAVKANCLELDQYLIDTEATLGTYTIDQEKLKRDLKALLKEGRVVIEGIMVAQILQNIGIKSFTHVYIATGDIQIQWDRDYGIYADKSLEQIFELEEKNIRLLSPTARSPHMRKQIMEYFFKKRPFETADYVLEVEEDL